MREKSQFYERDASAKTRLNGINFLMSSGKKWTSWYQC